MGQVRADAHYPDGSPVCEPGAHKHRPGEPGNPFQRLGRDEARAIASAKQAWLPTVKRPDLKPARGSTIRVGDRIVARFDLVPVTQPDGTVRGTLQWIDLRAEAAAAEQAALDAEAREWLGLPSAAPAPAPTFAEGELAGGRAHLGGEAREIIPKSKAGK